MARRPVVSIGVGLIALGLAGALVGAGWPGPARTDHDAPFTLRVTDARPSACRNGAARWTVGVDVVTRGRPGTALSTATLDATYAAARERGWHAATVAQSGDAFAPGRLIGPTGELRMHPIVSVTLPCDVSAARLIAAARIGDHDPRQTQATFVDDGIAMSMSSVGGIVLLLLIAALAARRLGATRNAA